MNQSIYDFLIDMARFGVFDPSLVSKPLPTLRWRWLYTLNKRHSHLNPLKFSYIFSTWLYLKRFDTRNDAIHSFGLSENVNSISWFHANSNQLVSGMSGRCLRIFDLRCNYLNKHVILILESIISIINNFVIRIH